MLLPCRLQTLKLVKIAQRIHKIWNDYILKISKIYRSEAHVRRRGQNITWKNRLTLGYCHVSRAQKI